MALDHTLAVLKGRFGGNVRRGSFPICATEDDWKERVEGRGNQLRGLDRTAVDFIRSVQLFHRDGPQDDPLVVLNGLDNDD